MQTKETLEEVECTCFVPLTCKAPRLSFDAYQPHLSKRLRA